MAESGHDAGLDTLLDMKRSLTTLSLEKLMDSQKKRGRTDLRRQGPSPS